MSKRIEIPLTSKIHDENCGCVSHAWLFLFIRKSAQVSVQLEPEKWRNVKTEHAVYVRMNVMPQSPGMNVMPQSPSYETADFHSSLQINPHSYILTWRPWHLNCRDLPIWLSANFTISYLRMSWKLLKRASISGGIRSKWYGVTHRPHDTYR